MQEGRNLGAAAISLLILMLAVSACSDESTLTGADDMSVVRDGEMNPMNEPASNKGTAQFEILWMEGMIDHHHMAVMMSEACLEKAIHESLREQCQAIITTQSTEIEMMQTWLLDWYGVTYEPKMTLGMMQKMEHMMSLSPEEFEMMYMEEMIRHHEKAIKQAEKIIKKAYHPELITLAENIIATQSQEIELFQTWLCEWYNECK